MHEATGGTDSSILTEGATVTVNDVDPAQAEAVADEIIANGGKGTPLPFDVTRFADVAAAIESSGGTDILVNNAGNAGAERFGALVDFAESDPGAASFFAGAASQIVGAFDRWSRLALHQAG